jgi:DNA excision repair protein ERCC-8
VVTCGHDQRIRVWDTDTGANTLANFGPIVRNSGLAPCIPVLPPVHNFQPGADVMFYPNEHEILGYELFDGRLLSRVRRHQGQAQGRETGASKDGQRNVKDRITSLAWRAHDLEMYSAHADGSIAAWKPRTEDDADLDEEEQRDREANEEGRKRKRGVLDEIYQGLTKKPITFGNMGL